MLSLFAIGAFYIFTSYASAIGWGTGNMTAFASNANPYYVLGHALWGAGWWFVVIAIINSAIGVGLACTNAASRVMYTMGQAGTLPTRFGRIHPVHQTPTFAIAFHQLSGIVAILLVGLLLNPSDIFGFLGTIATLAVIVLYVMANLALTAYIRREHPGDFNVWRHGVLPWVGTLALLPVLFVTVYPVPPWPFNITPYLFIAALIVGFGYMLWRERRHPGVLRRGATVLVGHRSDEQGDVDWDAPAAARRRSACTLMRRRGRACRDRAARLRAARRRAVGAHRDLPGAAGRGGGRRRPAAGLDALLVYADREHFANLSYLTRFDPRFEEALLILVPGRAPVLLVGNEGVAYAAVVPPGVEVIRYQSFSLVNQPRADSRPLPSLLAEAGLGGAGPAATARLAPAPGGSASPAGSTSARTTRRGRRTGSRCPPTW